MRKWCVNCCLVLALAVLTMGPVSAQSTVGTILGTVTDATKAVLPGVQVTITNVDTGISRSTVTDDAGNYKVVRLLPGRYRIDAELPGFKKAVVEGAVLQVNQEARFDLRLEVGEVTEQITVTAEALALLQTDDATVGQVVDQKKVSELPLNGRNFMQLITIGSGAAPILASGGGAITGETRREGLSYTISGQREVSTSYLIDGVEAKSEFFMMVGLQPSLDSIQEFKLQRNTFSAEFGAAAAVVNVAIRSGGNDFHGSLFEFHRNDILDSSQFQDRIVNGKKQKPPFRMNQFGGSIGGPIVKNQTFFFFGYEGLRRLRLNSFRASAIPSRFRNGDFSTLRDAKGQLIPIFDPLTFDQSTGQRKQFTGNVIPSNRFDPIGKKLLDQFYPAPQNESAPPGEINTIVAKSTKRIDDQYHVRIDHKISDQTNIFGRYSFFDSPIVDPLGYAPASDENFLLSSKNLAIGVSNAFSPRTINEFRFGYHDDRTDVIPFWDGGNITEALGIKNLNPVSQQFGPPATGGVTFSGVGPFGWDIVSGGNYFQYTDILTLIRGAHTLKLGAEVRDIRPWVLAEDTGRRGTFNFDGIFTAQLQGGRVVPGTGYDVADFLLGIPRFSQGAVGSTYTEFDRTDTHVFMQDDWKVTPDFTLSAGLRYEYNMHGDPRDGKLAAFCPNCIEQGLPGKLILTDTGELRSQVQDPDWNNFAPRLGFAWTPMADKRTVIRGGFGIFYDNTKGDEMNFKQHHPAKTQLSEPINENPTPTFFLRDAFPKPPPGFNADPFVVDARDRWPYVLQWNLNLQRKLAADWMLEVGYLGSHGNKLSKRWNVNQAVLDKDPSKPTPIKSRQPFPRFGTVLGSFKAGISNYNSLQLRLERPFSHGFHFISGYTFSRCQDMDSSASFAADNQNVYDRRGDYALCGFHLQNRFNTSFGWEIPLGEGLGGVAGKLLKGWQVNSIIQLQDGMPFTPTFSGDPANVGRRYLPRMDRVCDGNLSDSEQTVNRFFDTSCFKPVLGRFGNSGRNVIFAPGFKSVDFSIFKNTYFTESAYVQFRAEVFNAFNFSNYQRPSNNFRSALYARVTSEFDAREFQFGLRVVF